VEGSCTGKGKGNRVPVPRCLVREREVETGPQGAQICERHATVICCIAGAMGDRLQIVRTEATVSRVSFAEAAPSILLRPAGVRCLTALTPVQTTTESRNLGTATKTTFHRSSPSYVEG
jgi:hypothetical protein